MNNNAQKLPLYDRIGMSTNLFLNEKDTLGLIEFLANQFSVVEVELEGELRAQTDEARNMEMADQIRKIGEKTGATINLHAPYIRIDYIVGNNKKEAAETILRAAEFSIRANAKVMTFHPGFRFPKNADKALRAEAIALTQELAMDLFHVNKHKGSNMAYCLENMGNERPFLTFTHDENEEIFSTSPISLTLDIAHVASYCETHQQAREEMTKFARYAGNVHLADINFPKHLHLPLGAGDFDYHDMVMAIEETGYNGSYIIEEVAGSYSGDEYLAAANRYRQQLKEKIAA